MLESTENVTIEIALSELCEYVTKKKGEDARIIQICSADTGDKFELSYSFAEKFKFNMETARIIIDKDEKVPSISHIYPYAFLYENEMKELFGVNIEDINLDYDNKLYRIDAVAPFKKEGKK